MKCHNCQATIPDGSKFCLICGAKQSVGKTCPNCGANELPEEAVFCPWCGKNLLFGSDEVNDEHKKENSFALKDARDLFFPLNGFFIGKTTDNDAERMNVYVDQSYDDGGTSVYWPYESVLPGLFCYRNKYEKCFDHMIIAERSEFPLEWKRRYNISFKSKYEEWLAFFHKYDFSVSNRSSDERWLDDSIHFCATSSDGRLSFFLEFDQDDGSMFFIEINYNED